MTRCTVDRRWRILFFETNEDGTVGGSHQAQYDLIRHLDRDRFYPIALYYQDQQFAQRVADLGVEVHIWDRQRRAERTVRSHVGKLMARMEAVRERVRFLRSLRIDLFHANNAPHKGYLDWLPAATIARIPAITHARGPYHKPNSAVKRWLARKWTYVITISSFIEQDLLAAGFPTHRLRKIFDGIDLDSFVASAEVPREKTRAELGITPDQFVVAMVGNIKRWKGQAVVIEALGLIDEVVRSRIRVLFIGDVAEPRAPDDGRAPAEHISYYDELQRMIADKRLTGCVTFLGRRDDVPDLMNAADVVVHASTQPEPFGLVVIEGMALGKPVIVANTGGPAEVLVPGSGLTFDTDQPNQLAQALTRLLFDPGLRSSLGSGARVRVREFTINRTVQEVERLYGELLGFPFPSEPPGDDDRPKIHREPPAGEA